MTRLERAARVAQLEQRLHGRDWNRVLKDALIGVVGEQQASVILADPERYDAFEQIVLDQLAAHAEPA